MHNYTVIGIGIILYILIYYNHLYIIYYYKSIISNVKLW